MIFVDTRGATMNFQIQMLGTGSAFSKKYYNTNALITCNNFNLLIDCGYTAPRSLHEIGITPEQIDGILITHIHADHVGGLEEMIFRLHYIYRKKIKLFITEVLAYNLWNYSLRGGIENVDEGLIELSDYFDIILIEPEVPFEIVSGLTIELISTLHIPKKPSYSVFINQVVFYSADIQFSAELLIDEVSQRRACRYILHDCQLIGPINVHTSLEQLLTLPDHIQANILLMHYDDHMERFMGQTGLMRFIKQHEIYNFNTDPIQ
ncbi:Ribonuclease Z [compost metagenome]